MIWAITSFWRQSCLAWGHCYHICLLKTHKGKCALILLIMASEKTRGKRQKVQDASKVHCLEVHLRKSCFFFFPLSEKCQQRVYSWQPCLCSGFWAVCTQRVGSICQALQSASFSCCINTFLMSFRTHRERSLPLSRVFPPVLGPSMPFSSHCPSAVPGHFSIFVHVLPGASRYYPGHLTLLNFGRLLWYPSLCCITKIQSSLRNTDLLRKKNLFPTPLPQAKRFPHNPFPTLGFLCTYISIPFVPPLETEQVLQQWGDPSCHCSLRAASRDLDVRTSSCKTPKILQNLRFLGSHLCQLPKR